MREISEQTHCSFLQIKATKCLSGPGPWLYKVVTVIILRPLQVTKQMKKLKQSYGANVHSANTGSETEQKLKCCSKLFSHQPVAVWTKMYFLPKRSVLPSFVGTGDLGSLVMNKKKAIVSDECLSHADECYNFGTNKTQNHDRSTKSKQTAAKKAADRPVNTASVVRDGSNKTSEQLDGVTNENVTGNDSSVWSQNQQKQLELALQQFPKTVTDRWTCIAQAVPGKTKVIQTWLYSSALTIVG